MIRRISLVLAGLASLWAVSLHAQEAVLGEMYGNGVHAYFGEDYYGAYKYLSSAINAGSKDPRCYYYRGLTLLALGRPEQADPDFQQGAKLETADVNRSYNVGKSLERVQGTPRASVERYRVGARLAAIQQSEAERKKYYDEVNRQQRRMSIEQTEKILGDGAAAGKKDEFAEPVKPDAKDKTDEPGVDEPADKSGKPPVDKKDELFSKPATPDKSGTDDIFANPPTKTKPAKPDDDPLAPSSKQAPPAKENPAVPDPVDPGTPPKPAPKADSKDPFNEDEPVPGKVEKPAAPAKTDVGAEPGAKPRGSFLGALGGAAAKAIGGGAPPPAGNVPPVPGKDPGFAPPGPGPGPVEKPAGGAAPPPPAGQPVPVPPAKAAPEKDLFE